MRNCQYHCVLQMRKTGSEKVKQLVQSHTATKSLKPHLTGTAGPQGPQPHLLPESSIFITFLNGGQVPDRSNLQEVGSTSGSQSEGTQSTMRNSMADFLMAGTRDWESSPLSREPRLEVGPGYSSQRSKLQGLGEDGPVHKVLALRV